MNAAAVRSEKTGPVICGVDTIESLPFVLENAQQLAAAYGARLLVVHAFDEPVAEAEDVLAAIRLRTEADRSAEIHVVEGSPADRILELARTERGAWLVVGAQGTRSFGAGIFGSVPRKLVQEAVCPLVIVRRGASALTGTPGRPDPAIVCGVDGSAHALAAVGTAADLAGTLDCRVALVHAPRSAKSFVRYLGRSTTPSLSVQPDALDRLTREILDAALEVVGDRPVSVHVEPGVPAEVLISVAEREGGRAIVVAGRGIGAVHAAVLGSVSESLVTSATVPVVVLPEGAEAAGNHLPAEASSAP